MDLCIYCFTVSQSEYAVNVVCVSYFHKVPDQPPELPVKATFGLASAEPYTLPPVNPAWTEDALKSLKSGKTPHDKPEVCKCVSRCQTYTVSVQW